MIEGRKVKTMFETTMEVGIRQWRPRVEWEQHMEIIIDEKIYI